MNYSFSVSKRHDKMRLNIFLREMGVSASLIRKIKFLPKGMLVNGEKKNADYILSAGDMVEINTDDSERQTTVIAQEGPIDIVYIDDCCMVVNKPRGQPAHPSFNHPTDTLANFFMGYWQARGENKICRIINRLDRNTSGLVIIALDPHSAEKLKGGVKKIYTAVVKGGFESDHGIIDLPIARQRNSIITRCVREDGQRAVTEYWVRKSDGNMSVLDIKLHTGRTHQIRVHLSHIGHSLEGDDLYGTGDGKISRHALHCRQLEFTSPATDEKITVSCLLPKDMQKLISHIRA